MKEHHVLVVFHVESEVKSLASTKLKHKIKKAHSASDLALIFELLVYLDTFNWFLDRIPMA